MSTLREVAELSAALSESEYRVLRALAMFLGSRMHVPLEMISASAGLPQELAESSLSILESLGMVVRNPAGYALVYAGLDALSLHELRARGQLDALGTPIALGKESDVYSGIAGSREVAVKAYRIGRVSFRKVKRLRSYGPQAGGWMLASIMSASSEFASLRRLRSAGQPVPEPLAVRYHLLVMERIDGTLLRRVREVADPARLLRRILEAIRGCYMAGLVHADLSEFNVMIRGDDVILIDWPQSIRSDDPAALPALERDIANIVRFFRKRFGFSADAGRALEYVLGRSPECC
jgi:RIO kinase 2